MKLTKTIGEMQRIRAAVKEIGKVKLPAPPSFRLARAMQSLDGALKPADETRNELVRRHGEQKGFEYVVPPENLSAFFKELNEMSAEMLTDIEVGEPLSIGSLDGAKIEAEHLAAASDLFVE